jgi:hypothetical protein
MLKKIINYLEFLKYKSQFITFNRNNFNKSKQNNNIILIEFNTNNLSIIAYSFFANYLKQKHKAEIISYLFTFDPNFFHKIKIFILSILNYKFFGIYKSFGVEKFLINECDDKVKNDIDYLHKKYFEKLKTKKDLLYLKIDDILIGDILYDSYLRINNLPTVDLKDVNFINFCRKFLKIFMYWNNYIRKNKNKVKAIAVSHCVYYAAIPMRICLKYKIDSYQVNGQSLYKLNKNELFAYKEFKIYPKLFKKIKDKDKNKFLLDSRKRLQMRFEGKIGIDMRYSKKSAYGKIKKKRLIKRSGKIKILIAAHCFSDSPHSYGHNIFNDFYEWIDTLGKITKETDYDWYVKTHPDYIASSRLTLIKLIKKYPKIKILPSDASHNQIIKEGINFVLTCYGTIAHEYAARNIVVINASINNPHIAYNFNYNPTSISEYKKTLFNLKKLRIKIDKKKVYEFYYMRYIQNANNWLIKDYKSLQNLIGYKSFSKPIIYKYLLPSFSKNRVNKINKTIKNFIESREYHLQLKHIN